MAPRFLWGVIKVDLVCRSLNKAWVWVSLFLTHLEGLLVCDISSTETEELINLDALHLASVFIVLLTQFSELLSRTR